MKDKRRTRPRKGRKTGRILFWLLVVVPVVLLGLAAILNWVVMPLVTGRGRELPVPELVGRTLEEAEQLIARAGLALGDVRTVDDTAFAPGRVVLQAPPAGRRVKPGRVVQLNVSRGANRLTVPDIAGMESELAIALLEEAGLAVAEIESLRMPDLPPGRVIATRPVAGFEVERGAAIVLAVSAPVGKFPMPNLIGAQLETAGGIIASQGLVLAGVQHAESDEPAGLVMVQFPEEGSSVASGDSVHLIVAVPVKPDSLH